LDTKKAPFYFRLDLVSPLIPQRIVSWERKLLVLSRLLHNFLMIICY